MKIILNHSCFYSKVLCADVKWTYPILQPTLWSTDTGISRKSQIHDQILTRIKILTLSKYAQMKDSVEKNVVCFKWNCVLKKNQKTSDRNWSKFTFLVVIDHSTSQSDSLVVFFTIVNCHSSCFRAFWKYFQSFK